MPDLVKYRLHQFSLGSGFYGKKNHTGRVSKEQDFADRESSELLNFYGVVRDNRSLGVEYAIVMVFACFTGRVEKPLAYTFTDREGRYFISIPNPSDNHDLLGFKVRAGKPHILSEAFDYPVNYKKESYKESYKNSHKKTYKELYKELYGVYKELYKVPYKELYEKPNPNTVQSFMKNRMPRQDNIATKQTFIAPGQDKISAKNDGVGLINLAKAGESESCRQPSEEVITVEPPNQLPAFEDNLQIEPNVEPIKKVENPYGKSELTSAVTFLLFIISLFGIWVADEKLKTKLEQMI